MRWAIRAEWTKLHTVPNTAWLLVATVALTVAVGAAITASVNTSQCPSPTECFEDTTKLSLAGVWLAQVTVAVLATLAMTNEYGTGLIQTTLTANPRRVRVLAAKATALTAAVLGVAALGVLGSLTAARIILPSNGFTTANGYPPLSLADEPTFRAALGTVIYLGLIALLSLGLGTTIRDTAAAINAVLTLLFLAPVITQFVSDPHWNARLQRYSPTAGLAIQATTRLDQQPIGPWAGLGLLAGYASASVLLGAICFKVRDA